MTIEIKKLDERKLEIKEPLIVKKDDLENEKRVLEARLNEINAQLNYFSK